MIKPTLEKEIVAYREASAGAQNLPDDREAAFAILGERDKRTFPVIKIGNIATCRACTLNGTIDTARDIIRDRFP